MRCRRSWISPQAVNGDAARADDDDDDTAKAAWCDTTVRRRAAAARPSEREEMREKREEREERREKREERREKESENASHGGGVWCQSPQVTGCQGTPQGSVAEAVARGRAKSPRRRPLATRPAQCHPLLSSSSLPRAQARAISLDEHPCFVDLLLSVSRPPSPLTHLGRMRVCVCRRARSLRLLSSSSLRRYEEEVETRDLFNWDGGSSYRLEGGRILVAFTSPCVPFHSVPFCLCSVPFHPIPFHSIPFHSIPFHSIPFRSIPFHSVPFRSIPFHSIPFHSIPFDFIAFHFIPFASRSRAHAFHPIALRHVPSSSRSRVRAAAGRGLVAASPRGASASSGR